MPLRPSRAKNLLVVALWRLLRDTRAATAVEYGLILALIVLGLMASFIAVADVTTGMWNNVSTKVRQAH